MKDEKRNDTRPLKSLWLLFINMLKIGLFTFGGGYAMIPLLENEFVSKKNWIAEEEFMDLVAIAESTPGPIAINCSTYIGYKKGKILGAILATLGMCIPSFAIILLISLFFNQFLSVAWVASAFKGIQVCVVFLILSAGVKMLKKMKKKPFNLIVLSVTFLCMVTFSVFAVNFSSIFYIFISGFVGLLIYLIGYFKSKTTSEKKEKEQ